MSSPPCSVQSHDSQARYVARYPFTEIFFAVFVELMERAEPKMGRSGPHARSYRPSTQG